MSREREAVACRHECGQRFSTRAAYDMHRASDSITGRTRCVHPGIIGALRFDPSRQLWHHEPRRQQWNG